MFDRDSSTGDARASGREDGIGLLCAGPDTDALELVRDRLERESEQFSTTAATTVTEALDHLERDAVDCVVSDHVPPDFDGLALLERVRRRDDAVPVLLFTAHGSEAIASAAIDGGVSGYVPKDAEDDQYESLSTRIQAAVDTHRESERLRKQTVGLELAETLFNNTQDALFVVDVSEEPFRLERVNPPYEELTGLSNERLRGRTLTEVFGEREGSKIIEQYRTCVESRTPLEYEEEVSVPSAGPYWDTRISPVIVEDRVETLVGATRNVTERKREQQAIERTEEFLTQVQRVADIGGWEVDERSGRLRWSAELRRIHGLPADYEPSVDATLEFVHPDDRETVEAAYERLASEGAHYDLELRFRTDDGELRWGRSRGEPWYEGDERVGARGTLQDITERKEYESELERTNERLDAFASVVSHDLRNPLVVAQGSLELYRERGSDADFERIAAAHERIGALITDLLTFARDGQRVSETVPLALAAEVETAFELIPSDDAALELSVGESTLRADQARLRQLLENLLSNAVRHGGRGVRIRVGLLEEGSGFYVADDGPGIPPDQRREVFAHGYSTSDEGTGLGLAIVSSIAAAHGWRVGVTESAEGGARFEVHTESSSGDESSPFAGSPVG